MVATIKSLVDQITAARVYAVGALAGSDVVFHWTSDERTTLVVLLAAVYVVGHYAVEIVKAHNNPLGK